MKGSCSVPTSWKGKLNPRRVRLPHGHVQVSAALGLIPAHLSLLPPMSRLTTSPLASCDQGSCRKDSSQKLLSNLFFLAFKTALKPLIVFQKELVVTIVFIPKHFQKRLFIKMPTAVIKFRCPTVHLPAAWRHPNSGWSLRQ